MAQDIEVFYDYISPFSYFAVGRLYDMAARHNAALTWKPMDLIDVEGGMPTWPPAKMQYMFKDLQRIAKRCAAPFRMAPIGPGAANPCMAAAIYVQDTAPDRFDAFHKAAYNRMWGLGKEVKSADALRALADEAGLDADAIVKAAQDEAYVGKLKANTDEAKKRGVFGAPSIFVGTELFWGQDRLDYVEEALTGA